MKKNDISPFLNNPNWEQTFEERSQRTEAAGVRGEGFKLENRKSVQAAIYLSASLQFEQKQSKSKCKQAPFEWEDRVWGKEIQNLNVKSINYTLKLKDHALEYR